MKFGARVIMAAMGLCISFVRAQGDGATDALPIAETPNTLLPCEPASQGWKLLHTTGSTATFDSNFTQWISGNTTNTALPTSWTYQASDQTIYSAQGTPDLRSEWLVTAPGNFDFRMTFRNSGNDGIFYKMLARGQYAWSVGIEYAIDNNVNAGKQSAGAVYDMWAPNPTASQAYNSYASGKWNQARIVTKGDSVEHWLNNRRVGKYKLWDAAFLAARANSKWSSDNSMGQNTDGCQCKVPQGYFGFQGDHDGTWHMRDIRIVMNDANVKLGPAGPCNTTGMGAVPAAKTFGYTLERLPGALRLNVREGSATKAEVKSLDGKSAALAVIEENGAAVVVRDWKQSGLYFLRLSMRGGNAPHRIKIFLP